MLFLILSQISQISQIFFLFFLCGIARVASCGTRRLDCERLFCVFCEICERLREIMLITFFIVDNSVDKFFKIFCTKVGISGKKCIILKAEKIELKWIIR